MVTDGMSSRSLIGNNIVCRNMVYIILHREFEVHEIYVRNGSIISFHTYIRYVIYIIYIYDIFYMSITDVLCIRYVSITAWSLFCKFNAPYFPFSRNDHKMIEGDVQSIYRHAA